MSNFPATDRKAHGLKLAPSTTGLRNTPWQLKAQNVRGLVCLFCHLVITSGVYFKPHFLLFLFIYFFWLIFFFFFFFFCGNSNAFFVRATKKKQLIK